MLLLQALAAWRAGLGPDAPPDRLPASAAERSALKAALNGLRRSSGEEGLLLEVRLPEAAIGGLVACAAARACRLLPATRHADTRVAAR